MTGNIVSVESSAPMMKNSIAFVHTGDASLKGEVLRVQGHRADLQIFEETQGVRVGDRVEKRSYSRISGLISLEQDTVRCGSARAYRLGEAALTPAANSLIADHFPRAEQNRAITFFNMGISTGMGVAYLIGGAIVAWMTTRPPMVLPVFGELATWQVVFILAGAPGLLVALLLYATVREPLRRERLKAVGQDISIGECVAYLRAHRRAYAPLMIGMGASPLIGYAWNWLPTLFDRVWGWNVAQFTGAYGVILLIFGPRRRSSVLDHRDVEFGGMLARKGATKEACGRTSSRNHGRSGYSPSRNAS
ncbi:MAG: MFS transporter [Pleurocapsa sp. SU_196_0]|nr:MFS transporter [Pleurocapsa sp. SU_196_0]